MDKKFWFQLLGLIVVILGATFFAFNQRLLIPFTSQFNDSGGSRVTIPEETRELQIIDPRGNSKATLQVIIADTNEERSKGLGGRDSLATNSGMLFIHDSPKKYTYWMKDMRIPIDIIWVLDDRIADIIPDIPPPLPGQSDETLERYSSTVDVNRVLETNAGFVQRNGIAVGDKIILK